MWAMQLTLPVAQVKRTSICHISATWQCLCFQPANLVKRHVTFNYYPNIGTRPATNHRRTHTVLGPCKPTFDVAINSMAVSAEDTGPAFPMEERARVYGAYKYWRLSHCWWECLKCGDGEKIRGVGRFNRHVREHHHGIRWEDYTLVPYWRKPVQLQHQRCHLCGVRVMKDSCRMRSHLAGRHPNVTLKNYFLQHVYTKRDN